MLVISGAASIAVTVVALFVLCMIAAGLGASLMYWFLDR